MRKIAVVVIFVSVLTFSAVGGAMAQKYAVTLCVDGFPTHLIAEELGNVGGKNIFAINGWIDFGYNDHVPVSGTATIAGGVIHWGLIQLESSTFYPVMVDFTTNLGMYGSGHYEFLTGLEYRDLIVVHPGPCP